ncbi:MAG: 30S ribosome-binding factor RbfA [Chloroflexi bacterium]|nr:30S ribosome-binding factor RbfA [Chloroflexota bacterium]
MSRRIERLNQLLRERLSELLLRETKDPRISGLVSITSVEVSADLQHARVHISILGEEEEKKATMEGLRSAAGFLRRGLEDLSLRHIPTLTFLQDDSIAEGDRMLRLIRDVRARDAKLGG